MSSYRFDSFTDRSTRSAIQKYANLTQSLHIAAIGHTLTLAESPNSTPHDRDTIVFDLRVRCDRIPHTKNETDPRKMYYDSNVYTGMMEWGPSGDQDKRFKGREPRPVDPDILLVKLRPGQVSETIMFGAISEALELIV